MDVSVIFVNYKTSELTHDAINSVIEKTSNLDYEIIVVDNSDSNEEFEKLKDLENLGVKLVNANGNLGFGKANNLGSKIASGKYLFFLNTDTLLINNAIYELFKVIDSDNKIGIVGANLYKRNGDPNESMTLTEKNIKREKKDQSTLSIFLRNKMNKRKDFNYANEIKEVNGFVCGAALMIRKDAFDKIEGFDKDIFMYSEEVLLCRRVMKELNLKIYNVPQAKITHFEGESFKQATSWHASVFVDGNYIYYTKAFGKVEALKYLKLMKKIYKKKVFISKLIRKKERVIKYNLYYEAFNNKLEKVK